MRVGSGTGECEVEVGDGGEIGRGEDGEAAAVADGGSADGSRRGHQTDVPYSGAKAATWSSMRATSGTSGTFDGEVEGARRLVGQIASGSAVCDATNLVWTGCGLGLASGLVAGSPGRLVALGSEGSRLTARERPQPCLSGPIPLLFLSCPVQSRPVLASPSRNRGQSLNAAVLRCCRPAGAGDRVFRGVPG